MKTRISVKDATKLAQARGATIRGNGQAHDLIYWFDLTSKEKKEFDSLDTTDRQENAIFFRYRGNVYDLGEFSRVESYAPKYLQCFDAYASDTFFSGIGIRLTEDNGAVFCYTLYS